MNKIKSFGQKGRGFTLIELLVVIAIIGLLASVILASLNTARQKGRDARRLSDVKELQLALELYYDSNSQYPTALSALAPTYISVIPTDPSTNAAYAYASLAGSSSSGCGAYHLGATLEVTGQSSLGQDADGTAGGTYGSGASDGAVCTGSAADFNGLAIGAACTGTVGTAGPAGTETCYDVKP